MNVDCDQVQIAGIDHAERTFMYNSSLQKASLLMFSLFVFASCGNPERAILKQVKVQSYYDNADVMVKVNAMLNIGNMSLPSMTIPIYYPPLNQSIGTISLTPNLSGMNEIAILVNVSSISNITGKTQTLPNGATLPLIGSNRVIKIPIDRVATLYLTLEHGAMALGAAINISSFDQMGSNIGTTAFFPVFNLQGVIASAGLYTSKNQGQNGIGLFVDLSQALSNGVKNDLLARRDIANAAPRLNYSELNPSSSSKSKINDGLYKLHQKKTKLKLFR